MIGLTGNTGSYQIELSQSKKGKFGGICMGCRVEDQMKVTAKRLPAAWSANELEKYEKIIQIQHPNLTNTLEIIEYEGHYYLIREFYNGTDFKTLFKKHSLHKHLSTHFLLRAVTYLLDGLKTLHENGIIHRDIKPSNIILRHSPDLHPSKWKPEDTILIDFEQSSTYPCLHQVRTPFALVYSPPEQLLNRSELIHPSSDLFSLGITLYEMLAGRPPYVDCNAEILLNLQLTYPIKRPSGMDEELFSIIAKAAYKCPFPLPPKRLATEVITSILQKGISERYQNAWDFREAIAHYLQTHPEKDKTQWWLRLLKP